MDKAHKFNELKATIQADLNLPFRNTATNLVIGQGSLSPKVLFLGEAPGKNEDLTGIPFNGAAGKVLDLLLDSVNLARDQVYITSVLMYRPPNNRDPKPAEITLFEPYLDQLIDLLNPPIIATLGNHSLGKFIPGKKISAIHGQLQTIIWHDQEIKILPLYHPAAVLYNPKLKNTLIEDIRQLKK